jgi:hypothetical protein
MRTDAIAQTIFEAERVSKTASFVVGGKVEDVFPLFGPIREKDWAEGWNPEIIYNKDAVVAQHMIFRTKAETNEDFYNWAVTTFQPTNYVIEYTVSTSNRIWFIQVKCKGEANATKVTVTYTYTGLNHIGNELNRAALKNMFADDLKDWQQAINYYLHNGKMLKTTTLE